MQNTLMVSGGHGPPAVFKIFECDVGLVVMTILSTISPQNMFTAVVQTYYILHFDSFEQFFLLYI